MVQENTSNTDADTEIKKYPAPSPLNRVGIKVGLGMGLLLSLFAFAGLISLFQARVVDENVRQITEVEEPSSAAAYEMEINVIGTGLGVFKYLQTGDEIHRWQVAKDEADFERFKAQYDLLADSTRGRQLGDRLNTLYREYNGLGETLMDQADRREVLFAVIAENFEGLDGILDEKIQANVDPQGPDGPEKLIISGDMEADIAQVGTWLGSYLRTPREEYKSRVFDNWQAFQAELNQLKSLGLTEEEQGWVVELEDLFSQTQDLSMEIIALEDDLDANLAEFVALRTRLDSVLGGEIQVLTRQNLAEATQVAQDMEARTNTLVFLLLLGGLACGTLVAVAITRVITDPVAKLVSASRAIAKGDLFQRVDIQSKDEFGILGESFNEMIVQRQQAHTELEVRVRERTEELSQVNEVMDLADEVARIVTSTLNIDDVYQKFALEVKKMVDFDRMNINIIDYERGIYEIKYHYGEEAPQRSVSFTGPLEGTTTGEVAKTGQTLVQHDIALDRRSPGGEKYLKMGLVSNIKVPLIIKGRVIGTLGLRSRRVGAYEPREQAILERLASQIAPAMESAQLYLRLQANMEEMDLADEVARIVTSTLNIDEVYEKFALELKKLVDFDRININIIDPSSQTLLIKYLSGPAQPGREKGDIVPLVGTMTQEVITIGQTLIRDEFSNEIDSGTALGVMEEGYLKLGLRASIAVPLISNGSVIGTLLLRSCQSGCYGSKEQAILERLASQIAPAIENARLHEERVRAEEQLSHARRMESVGRLAGGVAHDFNNLLTAIMGYTQLSLGETSSESNMGSHLREIQKATQRATNLTSQLLTFSRHQVVEPKVIDLNDLIIDLDKMLRRLIGEDIELVTLPATDLDPVKVDRGQMEQVLMNLAVNARDAILEGGKITVETANVIQDADYVLQHPGSSTGRQVMLSVTDTGTGIPEEVRDHIFEPFFTTKEVGKGTGLGLATCYGIVQQSGGHIEVDSEPGQGTTFKVYLPVTEETFEAQPTQVDSRILPQGKETVLLAEDEPLVRSMVATVLRDRGYAVLETANGAEALGMVQKHDREDIQLLLTDVVMPQMSGPELAEQVWATHPDIKVLFTSGYTGDSISIVNNYPTSTNFLPKPYMPEALAVKVREVLDQQST